MASLALHLVRGPFEKGFIFQVAKRGVHTFHVIQEFVRLSERGEEHVSEATHW
jgi:hypothetical protein